MVWSHPGIQHTFSLLHPSMKNESRGEEGELRVERKVKLFKKKKKNTHTHTHTHTNNTEQKSQSNRAKFASPDKALLDRFTMFPSPSRVLPSTQGKMQNESEAILFLKAEQTHREHISRTVRRVVICWALPLSLGCNLQSILRSAALLGGVPRQRPNKRRKGNGPNNKIPYRLYNHRYKLLRSIISFLLKTLSSKTN